jgi:predicted SAM-dependent methyltransferase
MLWRMGVAGKLLGAGTRVMRELRAPFRQAREEVLIQIRIRRCKKLLADYLNKPGAKLLHMGCGRNRFDGWFNTDILQDYPDVGYVDAAQPFKMPSNLFDYAFSEHMIEHIPWPAGQNMLSELCRVLKPGGVVRIATPDLKQILALAAQQLDTTQQKYLAWSRDRYSKHISGTDGPIVINNFFYSWGHAFIYDFDCMKAAMELAGLRDVKRCLVGQSDHAPLAGRENHGAIIGNDFSNLYETMVVEATKAS